MHTTISANIFTACIFMFLQLANTKTNAQSAPFRFSVTPSATIPLNGQHDTTQFSSNGGGCIMQGDFYPTQTFGIRVQTGVSSSNGNITALDDWNESKTTKDAGARISSSQSSFILAGPVLSFGNKFYADLSAQVGAFFHTTSAITVEDTVTKSVLYRTEPASQGATFGFGSSFSLNYAISSQWALGLSASVFNSKTSVNTYQIITEPGTITSTTISNTVDKNLPVFFAGISISFSPSCKTGSNEKVEHWGDPHEMVEGENAGANELAVGDEGVTEDKPPKKKPKSGNLAVNDEGVTEKVAVDEPGVIDNRVNGNDGGLTKYLDPDDDDDKLFNFLLNETISNPQVALAAINSSNSNIKNLYTVLDDASKTLNADNAAAQAAVNISNSNIKNLFTELEKLEGVLAEDDWLQPAQTAINSSNSNIKNLVAELENVTKALNTDNSAAQAAINNSNSNIKNMVQTFDTSADSMYRKADDDVIDFAPSVGNVQAHDDWETQAQTVINNSNSNIKNLVATLDDFDKIINESSGAAQVAVNSSNSNIKNLLSVLDELDKEVLESLETVKTANTDGYCSVNNLSSTLDELNRVVCSSSGAAQVAVNSSNSNIKNLVSVLDDVNQSVSFISDVLE